MPSRSSNSVGAVLIALCGACATQAPELPPDYGSVAPKARLDAGRFGERDLRYSCADIDAELARNDADRRAIEAKIQGDHRRNQIVGYFSGFLPPLLVAAKMNLEEKERFQALYKRRDDLFALKRLKSCG